MNKVYCLKAQEEKNGTQHIMGTNTCHWILCSQVPKEKKGYVFPEP